MELIISDENLKSINRKRLIINMRFASDTHADESFNLPNEEYLVYAINIKVSSDGSTGDINIINRIRSEIKRIQVRERKTNSDTILIGTKVSATIAMNIAYLDNYDYLACTPHFSELKQKNTVFLEKMGVRISELEKQIEDREYSGHGKVIYSHYDVYSGSYNASILRKLNVHKNIQLVLLEDYFMGQNIRVNKYQLVGMVKNEILKMLSGIETVEYRNYFLKPENPKSKKTTKYGDEKNHHELIGGFNRCLKYKLTKSIESDFLVVTFCGEIGPNGAPDVNHDITCVYALNFLKDYPINTLFIRSTFGVTGGFNTFDYGEEYPPELVLKLIEKQRLELGISKSRVLLAGASAGGTAALSYAEKGGYKHVMAMQPCIEPQKLCVKRPWSYFQVRLEDEKLNRVIEEECKKHFNFYDKDSDVNGIIFYSNKDTMEGMAITDKFKSRYQNIKYIDVSDDYAEDEVEHGTLTRDTTINYVKKQKLILKYLEELDK